MKINRWSGFFTNLLGVILGITLTFGVNSLWQKREEKKKRFAEKFSFPAKTHLIEQERGYPLRRN